MKKILLSVVFFAIIPFLSQSQELEWFLDEDEQGLLFIALKINDLDEELTCILDTGTTEVLNLPIDTINKIEDKVEKDDKRKRTDILGNIQYSRQFMLRNVKINNLLYEKLEIEEYKPWGAILDINTGEKKAKKEQNFDYQHVAVAGLGFFVNKVVTFDIISNKLILSDNFTKQIENDWLEIPFTKGSKGHLILNATDDVKSYALIFDTGAGKNIISSKKLSNNKELIKLKEFPFYITELSFVDIPNFKDDFIVLDGLTDDLPADGILGNDFLYSYIVKIDFKNQKMWIKPQPEE